MPKGISIFGKKVAALRKKRSLTQASLRDRIGGSLENVKRIEGEEIVEVGIELIPRLATALAVDVSELKVDQDDVEVLPDSAKDAITLAVKSGNILSVLQELDPGVRESLAKHLAAGAEGRLSRKAAKKGQKK